MPYQLFHPLLLLLAVQLLLFRCCHHLAACQCRLPGGVKQCWSPPRGWWWPGCRWGPAEKFPDLFWSHRPQFVPRPPFPYLYRRLPQSWMNHWTILSSPVGQPGAAKVSWVGWLRIIFTAIQNSLELGLIPAREIVAVKHIRAIWEHMSSSLIEELILKKRIFMFLGNRLSRSLAFIISEATYQISQYISVCYLFSPRGRTKTTKNGTRTLIA